MDRYHQYTGYQGQDCTLSLIKECFWWPEMVQETIFSVRNCTRCVQFKARLQKPGLEPIMCTEPVDLVHIDYVKDVLMVEDHFTSYNQAYVTKNNMVRTTA